MISNMLGFERKPMVIEGKYADALTRLVDAYRHEREGCCTDEDTHLLEEVRKDKMLSESNDAIWQ